MLDSEANYGRRIGEPTTVGLDRHVSITNGASVELMREQRKLLLMGALLLLTSAPSSVVS